MFTKLYRASATAAVVWVSVCVLLLLGDRLMQGSFDPTFTRVSLGTAGFAALVGLVRFGATTAVTFTPDAVRVGRQWAGITVWSRTHPRDAASVFVAHILWEPPYTKRPFTYPAMAYAVFLNAGRSRVLWMFSPDETAAALAASELAQQMTLRVVDVPEPFVEVGSFLAIL